MPSTKRLSSVCHSIAHHAASGLSFIHPNLRHACRDVGIVKVVVDLMRDDPYPTLLHPNERLRLALINLRKEADGILSAETLMHKSGRVFADGANELGQRVRKLD